MSESNTESQQATETEAEDESDDEQQHTAADELQSASEQTPESEADTNDQQRTAAAESETDAEVESDSGSVDTTDQGEADANALEADVGDDRVEGLLAVRQTVERTAARIIGRKFDGVSEITPTEDGWRAVVEVVERSSVPDTMDVLGRYEVDLNEDGVIEGYRRIDRYRRGDTVEYESG